MEEEGLEEEEELEEEVEEEELEEEEEEGHKEGRWVHMFSLNTNARVYTYMYM